MAAHAVNTVLQGHNLTRGLAEANALFPQATSQQRGAAMDYAHNTCRFLANTDAHLQVLLSKPLTDLRLRALLLVALTQLQLKQDDAFTVVNQAVQAASMFKRPKSQPWMKGLCNAVLRNFLRQHASAPTPPKTDDLTRLYNYPAWWIRTLQQQYPEHWSAMLQAGNAHPPMTLRVNLQRVSRATYLESLRGLGIEGRALGDQAIMLSRAVAVTQLPGFEEGWVSVQDWGAQLAARYLDVHDGQRVLDACAAPGGKTGHLLELADIHLTALDNDAERLARVRSNVTRLARPALLCEGDAATQTWWDGQLFDRILADVPCSASGVVRRHVDIKWLRKSDDIGIFATQQAQILRNLWQLLAKGGKLLYATCSVFQQENAAQIEAFLAATPDAYRIPLPEFSNTQEPSEILECSGDLDRQLRPCVEHDGFYYALLEKR